jgi:hypothetical protein
VLFSNDKLLVGESDYACTSNSIEARDDSNIMISYGTINFRRARDEKYTGNVSFILNNEVDVTPSRENVIWNTREAVKKCLSQLRKR